jgi:ABC-type multidrug transport system ATPase subunit
VTQLLHSDCIGKRYGAQRVLSSATLRAHAGRITALLGRNGIGKSTLMKISAGIIWPDTGTVRWNGDVTERPSLARFARAGLMYVPDDGFFARSFSVGEQLRWLAERYPGGDVSRAAARCGVERLLNRTVRDVSGGERRRAELAGVLVRRPTCVLADEPFRDVSPIDAEFLIEILREVASGGCAVVISGHEVETLFALADDVTWCTDGTTYELGPPWFARSDARFRQGYLGVERGIA